MRLAKIDARWATNGQPRRLRPTLVAATAVLGTLACGRTGASKADGAITDGPVTPPFETSLPVDPNGPSDPLSTQDDRWPTWDGPTADVLAGFDGGRSIDSPPTFIDASGPAIIDAPIARDIAGDPVKPWVEVSYSPDVASLAELCTRTGGQVSMIYCWVPGTTEFFDTCTGSTSACAWCKSTCRDIAYCVCPNNGCFAPLYGCLTKSNCTVGADQTCNDNPALPVIHGHCVEAAYCQCSGDVNPLTGKCL